MPHVEILYKQIQTRQTDTIRVKNAVNAFVVAIQKIRENVGLVSQEVDTHTHTGVEKRRRTECARIPDAIEVCNRITTEAHSWFQNSNHLDSSKLLDSLNFLEYSKLFPENIFELTVDKYPLLNKNKLRTELSVLYEREDLRDIVGAVSWLNFFVNNNLEEVFQEVVTLLRIIITIPMTTSEPERCFSSLNRVKTFLQNTMSQERLTALAMLSIEKKLLNECKDFNTRFIEKFAAKKNRRMELHFRY